MPGIVAIFSIKLEMAEKQKQNLVHDPIELVPVHIALNHIHLLATSIKEQHVYIVAI